MRNYPGATAFYSIPTGEGCLVPSKASVVVRTLLIGSRFIGSPLTLRFNLLEDRS